MVFEKMPSRDVISWTTLLTIYANANDGSSPTALVAAGIIFDSLIPERNAIAWSVLIRAYAERGRLSTAMDVFSRMPQWSSSSWSSIISCCAQHGDLDQAHAMIRQAPLDLETISWNAIAFSLIGIEHDPRAIFDRMERRNSGSWHALLQSYTRSGRLDDARAVLDRFPVLDAQAWGELVSGYAQAGHLSEARELSERSPERDAASTASLVAGYGQSGWLGEAREIFDRSPRRCPLVWTTLIQAFSGGRDARSARLAFERMPAWDSSSWSAIVGAYAQNHLADFWIKPVKDHFNCMADVFCRSGWLDEATELLGLMPFPADLSALTGGGCDPESTSLGRARCTKESGGEASGCHSAGPRVQEALRKLKKQSCTGKDAGGAPQRLHETGSGARAAQIEQGKLEADREEFLSVCKQQKITLEADVEAALRKLDEQHKMKHESFSNLVMEKLDKQGEELLSFCKRQEALKSKAGSKRTG
ncbi:hypothetical protein SELMODRAFT_423566 [Selaginella moellendorffii]|uniref:Pentatricopeptide repeat-containing protein n=1 Tax=Selaginella moellendorffii TaxID=88036 RepID=D8SM35_SELML|nr:hypothetical protein SELMODRAFT_423566 [Selaginella moellendorffii]